MPLDGLIVPTVELVSAQAYVIVPEQVELHFGVAVKNCLPPKVTVGAVGLTDTEVRVTGAATVMTVELPLVVPLSVALTNMPPVTAALPAVKIIDTPEPVREPMALLVRVHVYEMPEVGQVALHVGVAEKVCVPPSVIVGFVGLNVIEERVVVVAVTVSVVVVVAECFAESLTKTWIVNFPEADEAHVNEAILLDVHPGGRAVYE
jgi:hypothetical protein